MAEWSKNRVDPSDLNNGQEYTINDNVSLEALNAIVNNSLYAEDVTYKANEKSDSAVAIANEALEQARSTGTRVTVGGAFQSTFDADTKADLSFVNSQLNTKANQTDLNATNTSVANNTSNISTLMAGKADIDASNITVASYQTKLNDLAKPNLTDATAHTQAGQATVVESYLSSDKKTWYRIWSDGWKECGGSLTTRNDDEITYTLPITFSNTSYTAIGSYADTSGYPIIWTRVTSTSQIHMACSQSGNKSMFYYCCGY